MAARASSIELQDGKGRLHQNKVRLTRVVLVVVVVVVSIVLSLLSLSMLLSLLLLLLSLLSFVPPFLNLRKKKAFGSGVLQQSAWMSYMNTIEMLTMI
jgi:apolipoprotein N-acyltransferase